MPEQYVLVRAAKILGMSAPALAKEPIDGPYGNWVQWAIICEKADRLVEDAMSDGDYDDDDDDD